MAVAKNSFSYLLFAGLMFLLTILTSCTRDASQPVRALLITGGGWHDYVTQERLLIDGINERMGERVIEWTIIHEGDTQPDHHVSVLQQPNWTEGYDIIVHNTGFGRVTDPGYVAHLVEHHKGTPALLIHAAVHSYRYAEPADPWFGFTGVQSMWHEGQRPSEVENIAPEHPIMQGSPEKWITPDDEIYVVEELWGEITPLARAWGEETGEYHPVAWTHENEGVKVFATTLGHNNEIFEREEFLNMIANGFIWAVDR